MVAGAASKLSQMRAIKLLNGRTHKKEEEASKSKPFYLLHSTPSFFSFSRFSLRRGPVVKLLDNQATTLKPFFLHTYLEIVLFIFLHKINSFYIFSTSEKCRMV